MSNHSSIVTAICMAALLQACASSKALHYKDGTEVHVVHCTGASWVGCLEQASGICKANGYDVVEKSTAKSSGFFSSTDNKELIIRCKSAPPAAATPAPVTVAPAVTPAPITVAPSGAIIAPAGAPTATTTSEPATPSTSAPQAQPGNVTPSETTSPSVNTPLPTDVPASPASNPEAKSK